MKLHSSSTCAAIGSFVVALGFLASGVSAQTTQKPQQEKPATSRPADKQERQSGGGIRDGWLTMKIHAQFVTEDALDGSDIDVDANGGVVTLTGTVASEAGRTRAVTIAKTTDGVKNVVDKLRIATAGEKDASGAAKETGREAGAAGKETARGAGDTTNKSGRRVTDGYLKSKIYSQFLAEDTLEDSDIDITVKSGAVTLTGTVATAAARTRAVALAKQTDGVKSVKDSLRVAKR